MTAKYCCKCSVELVQGENWSEGSIRNRNRICRSCNSAKGKGWSKANREHARSLAMQRRQSAPERIRAYKAEYYQRNKDRWREYHKTWRDAWRSDPKRRAQLILTFTATRAKRKGIDFDLTLDFLLGKIVAGKCEVTGLPFSFAEADRGKKKVHPYAPSVDRIDPHQGYVQSNVRVVVYHYNVAKADFSDNELLVLAHALVARADQASTGVM